MITMEPIGFVRSSRREVEDDNWGGLEVRIELTDKFAADALQGLEDFSHAEILYYFDKVDPSKIVAGARHPRNNPLWPRIGIFAQRGKNRPNQIGSTIVRVLQRIDRTLIVGELDAIDGTPVLDIKPVMREFMPRSPISQPDWVGELMQQYWQKL